MTILSKRWLYAVWLVLICSFAVLHALNLSADFPNNSPWFDWAKYTDEGWWGNAAIRAHLTGNWYQQGDYNPAPVVPVWPFLEWVLFFFTGVTIQAARGLAVAFFFCNLLLTYLLLRPRGPRWMALLALSLLVTSPFLYSFSRLAILEPMLITLTLAALNLAVRLPRLRHPVWASVGIGLLFTLMVLTKTSAVFLLPALGWAILLPLLKDRRQALRCALTAVGSSAVSLGLWMTLVVSSGMLHDYQYFFLVNTFSNPKDFLWPLGILLWTFYQALKIDPILIPLAAVVVFAGARAWRCVWGRKLLLDPAFGASVWAIAGYILFIIYHFNLQHRYYTVVAVFSFLVVAQGAGALLNQMAPAHESNSKQSPNRLAASNFAGPPLTRFLGWAVVALAALAVGINGAWTIKYAIHPEYTFVNAARQLTRFMDDHPNGRRLLVSVSGDQIALVTHLSTLCVPSTSAPCAVPGPGYNLGLYRPGWYAEWNAVNPGTLAVIHTHFSLEQVASFRAFDDPRRNVLVLFKLHPLPAGQVRNPAMQNLRVALPDDKLDIPIR
jgi:hypothetical protein